MSESIPYPPGAFCWVELATRAPEAAKRFYGAILGWTEQDVPTDYGIPYTHLLSDGQLVAALYEMAPEQGAFPYWAAFVRVTDVQASAARAARLGGRIVMPVVESMGRGRMCFIQDPTRAVIGLWEPRRQLGAALDNAVGARRWCELQTRNVAVAAHFYRELFGWIARPVDAGYLQFELAGQAVGGMLQLDLEWGSMPSNWSVCFGVADCAQIVAETQRHGGSLVMVPTSIAEVGRRAVLGDPQGAIFAALQLE